jgi:tetratricopeptide (TPR) repeat protein
MHRFLELAAPLLRCEPGERLEVRQEYSESLLLSSLQRKTTIAFLGSGISAPFGYPTWRDLALEILEETAQNLGSAQNPRGLEYIKSLQEGAGKRPDALDANALMFLIGACRTALDNNGRLQVFYDFFSKKFSTRSKATPPAIDPFAALLELPVRRFATTNYDGELERALAGKPLLSFTQKEAGLATLVRFSLAGMDGDEDGDYRVFHCHGRYDERESVIATEADYQKWYLGRQDGASVAYQQSLEFLLGSNPLLFVGYGLRDEDLLRPLRQLGALDPARKSTRPLFALMGCSAERHEADLYRHEAFYERFGVHVLSFDCRKGESLTCSLSRELRRLSQRLRVAHREASEKPKLKRTKPMAHPPEPHWDVDTATHVPVKPLPKLEEAVSKPGLVVLVGPSGSGKSFHALELVRSRSREFAGAFYWNAHYANESVTTMDAALSYFDRDKNCQGGSYERILRCFEENRFLLVIDGCERLLDRGKAGEGESYSITFRRLLRAFTETKILGTVVLAGRLRFAELAEIDSRGCREPAVRIVQAERSEARDVVQDQLFADLPEEDLSALCSLLRGHVYGLRLAGEYLRCCPDKREGLRNLIGLLADARRDERLNAMVFLLVRKLDSEASRGLAEAYLRRLGLFLSPVCGSARRDCFDLAWQDVGKGAAPAPDATALFEKLRRSGLLLPMHQPGNAKPTYTVHVTVRAALFQHPHGLEADPLPAFGLSGFTSGRLGIDPDPAYSHQIKELFERLLANADASLKAGDLAAARNLCRDAYGLIRTRMEANTAPRWCKYDEYLQFGLKVAVLAKQTAPGVWSYCEHPDASRFAEHGEAPLYPAELAWLYNDVAMAASAAGNVPTACAFWEQTYEISRLIEDPATGGSYHAEVLLSLAYSIAEQGRLSVASAYLDDAERSLAEIEDVDVRARIHGLRGWIAHLQGNLQRAAELYDRCLKGLSTGRNLRAQSIFSKHLADVKLAAQQCAHEEADLLIRVSRSLAESGVFPELVANARMSEGHRLFRAKNLIQARREYKTVLQEAQARDCVKLEVRALTVLARLALELKDADEAREHAMKALSLANQYGLELRKSHGLIVLGLATLETGPSDLGIEYLRLAKEIADRQEYWARSREAENKLLELGIDPREEARPGKASSGRRPLFPRTSGNRSR